MLNFFLITLATSVNVFFGFLRFVNLLGIRFYYLYSPKVINIVVFSPAIDLWMWGASFSFIMLEILLLKTFYNSSFPRWTILLIVFQLASLAFLLINDTIACFFAIPLGFMIVGLLIYYGNGYFVATREEAASLALVCITGLLMLFELASISTWVWNIFDYEVPFRSTLRWRFPWIDLQLFNVFYPLTSWLFLVFLYSWMWIPASKYILSRIPALKCALLRIERSKLSPVQNIGSKLKLNNKSLALGLLLSLATAVFILYSPYIRLPTSILVGADSVEYYDWLKEMMQKGPVIAVERDRPFFNLLMYSIKHVTGSSPETVIRIMPIVLAVCLNLVVFWFVKVGTKNDLVALTSSLFSSLSFQTTVGVFASFLANWLALIETFLLLVFLLKGFEKHSWKHMSVSAVIGMAVLVTHPYTWNVLMAILTSLFVWIFLRRKSEERFEIAFLTFFLAASFLFYAVYTLSPFGKRVSHAEGSILNDVASNIGVLNFLNLQNGLASMVQIYVGGLFGNPLLLVLAVAGIFSMFDFTKRFNRIMLLWVTIPSLALLAVSPDPFYYRLVYLIPIQIQAAAGLHWILNKLENVEGRLRTSETFHMLKTSIIILVALFLLNYSLRSVDGAVIHILRA